MRRVRLGNQKEEHQGSGLETREGLDRLVRT